MSKIQLLSEYLGIEKEVFKKEGVLNRFIGKDLPMFIDPRLLEETTSIPEFKTSREKFLNHFRGVLKLIDKGYLSDAVNAMIFKELNGVGLGYSKKSDSGSGINKKLATKLVNRMKIIYEEGSSDPEMFELMPLFLDNFNYDRISDGLTYILKKEIYTYTSRIIKKYGTKAKTKTIKGDYLIPLDEKNKPILLIPEIITTAIPLEQESWFISTLANSFKTEVSKMIVNDWSKLTKEEKVKKYEEDVDIEKFLQGYLSKNRTVYDFEKDPKGKVKWYEVALEIAKQIKIPELQNYKDIKTIDDLYNLVKLVIERVRHHFETSQTALKAFYYPDKNNKDRKYNESQVQAILKIIAEEVCREYNVDISPEVNQDRGCLDFKFSNGRLKVVIEVKLTSNKNLLHGYEEQIPEYMRAEETSKGIYLVIINTERPEFKLEGLNKLSQDPKFLKDKDALPDIIIIDGRKKKSASKYKKTKKPCDYDLEDEVIPEISWEEIELEELEIDFYDTISKNGTVKVPLQN